MNTTDTTQHHREDKGVPRGTVIIKKCDECGSNVERMVDIERVICFNCRREKNRVYALESKRRKREM